MNREEQRAAQQKYEAWLKELDAEADKFDAERRAEYASDRDDFSAMLSAWGDKAEAEWDNVSANVEQAWHSLQEKYHNKVDA